MGKLSAQIGEGRRLSVRAVKGAGVWRSLERSGNPCTEGADGSGVGFSQEGMENWISGNSQRTNSSHAVLGKGINREKYAHGSVSAASICEAAF